MGARADRDEAYVLDLCDEYLGESGLREHRFDWLRGDPSASGRRATLPVDAYWPDLELVVEYRELQHDQPIAFFDKPGKLTVSGVHRGKQRALYDTRRDTEVPAHGLRLATIRPSDLDANSRGRLRRQNRKADFAAAALALAAAPQAAADTQHRGLINSLGIAGNANSNEDSSENHNVSAGNNQQFSGDGNSNTAPSTNAGQSVDQSIHG